MKDKIELYYIIAKSSGYVGNSPLFWALGGSGFTCHLTKAQLYSKKDAMEIHNSRDTDIPVAESMINAIASLQIDSQYLPRNWDKEFML